MRILFSVLSLLLLLSSQAHAAYTCAKDEDCSLNGNCKSGSCLCDLGWKGDDCGALDLLPATRYTGYNRTGEGISSWGGQIIHDPKNASLYHLIAAEFTHNCDLNYWTPYSRIIRATSDRPQGPYTFAAEVVGTFAHNPQVVYSDFLQGYLLVHIGCQHDVTAGCSYPSFSCDPGNTINGESGITFRYAKQIDGKWDSYGIVFGANAKGTWDCDTTNPAPYPLANGSIVLGYRGQGFNGQGTEYIGVAFTPKLGQPFRRLSTSPIFPETNEDPFIYQDRRGNWHMLIHSLDQSNGRVGRHAFARDFEGPWTFWSRSLTYNLTVTYTDGSSQTLCRRERPQVYFDAKGNMAYFISGVQANCNDAKSFTFIQPIRTS